MKRSILLIGFAFLFSLNFSYAQNIESAIDALSSQTNAVITVNKNSGIAQFIKFPHSNPMEVNGNTVYEKSISFLENHKGIYKDDRKRNECCWPDEHTVCHL